jgi:quinol---cytochrome c reductase iron-sulfur subunit, bacillus type
MTWRSDERVTPKAPDQALMARRGFLRWLSAMGAGAYAALLGFPALRAFFSPVRTEVAKDNWVKVADDIALIDLDVPVRLDFVQLTNDAWVESRTLNAVWVYTPDGEKFKAYNGHCTHLGCGFIFDKDRGHFYCPCHHGEFDVKSGNVLAGPPPRGLDELKVEVRDSAIYVNYKDYRLGVAERVET